MINHVAGSLQLQAQDLVLLLDLAGHSLGLGSALQILAVVDVSFKDLCKPKLIENKVESYNLIIFIISTMSQNYALFKDIDEIHFCLSLY